jgi:uncharacterized membrane protein YdjX (TVP38/TMEM64 family)
MQMKSAVPPVPARNVRHWVGAVILGLGAVALLVWAARSTGVQAGVARLIAELRAAGAWTFFSAMAVLPAAGFPLLPFALVAGPAFSPELGTGGVIACSILAVCANVTLTYWLGSTVLRPPANWLVTRLGHRLPDTGRHNAWILTLLVRLMPGPPFWMQSYVLGVARVRFVAYLVISTLVPAGYLAGAVIGGDAVLSGNASAAFFALGLVAVVGTGLYFLRGRLAARSDRRNAEL